MRPVNYTALNAVTATTNSDPIPAQFAICASAQAIATGTIAGTLKFQFSNDNVPNKSQVVNWTDVPSQTASITGTAGTFAIPKFDVCYSWLRLVMTVSGGTGTLTANYKGTDF